MRPALVILVLSAPVFVVLARSLALVELMECKARHNVPLSDVENIKNNKMPETKEGKCMVACVMKKLKMMTDDGNISVSGMYEVVSEKHKGHPVKLQRAKRIINECVTEVPSEKLDECETAVRVVGCTIRKRKEMKSVSKQQLNNKQ